MVLPYQSSEVPVTPKAGQNALLGCDTLLKLTLLSLHSASSHTLLEAPSDQITFCWWRDGGDEEKEDEEEEDDEEEEKEEGDEDEDEEGDEDEDDGKEPRTIGQGEMVNSLADNVHTMVDDQPNLLPKQGQEMHMQTPRLPPLAPAPWPQSPEACPQPQTLETHPLSRLEFLRFLTPQKSCPVTPTLQEAEAAGITLDVDVDQLLLGHSAAGDSLPDVPLPYVHLPEAHPDGSGGEEWTSPRVAEEALIVAFGLGSASCLVRFFCCNLLISGTDWGTRGGVIFAQGFCIQDRLG